MTALRSWGCPAILPGEPKGQSRDPCGIPILGLSGDQVLKRLQPSVALFQQLFFGQLAPLLRGFFFTNR